ncbi:MAG: NfeD family protein [Oscillospiraceae bacterium]|nr:NfeD family protein [Oscillospiraceae bacterium]
MENIMEPVMLVWLIGIIVFLILEGVTYQLVSIWFAVGAAGGLIASVMGARFNIQMTVFLAISIVLLICLRPVSKKLLRTKKEKTNVDSLIGKDVLITKEVNNLLGNGEGKINGMQWTVRNADGDTVIPEGETVTVEKVEGVKLIVKRKGE